VEQGTRTSTIGHALSASPVSLLAWYVRVWLNPIESIDSVPALLGCLIASSRGCRVGEKFLDWVDDPLSSQEILESVSLYWFTETFPRGIYFYREVRHPSMELRLG
jgi:microsomal epoxide hydrolase